MTKVSPVTSLPTLPKHGQRLSGAPAVFGLPVPADTSIERPSGPRTVTDDNSDISVDHGWETVETAPFDAPIALAAVGPDTETPSMQAQPAPTKSGPPSAPPSALSVQFDFERSSTAFARATPPPPEPIAAQLSAGSAATTAGSAAANSATAPVERAVDAAKRTPSVRSLKSNAVPPVSELSEQAEAPTIALQMSPDIPGAPRRYLSTRPPLPTDTVPAITERVPIEHVPRQAFRRSGELVTEWSTDQSMLRPVQHDGDAAFVAPVGGPDGAALPIASGMTASVPLIASATPVPTMPVLDIDSGGQWIDRLAVEISTAAHDGGARLKLTPDNLGELTIVIKSGDSGASVVITTQDEAVRSMLAGAQDRLTGEARAHGLRLADVQAHLSNDSGTAAQQNGRHMPEHRLWDGDKPPKRTMRMQSDNHEEALTTGRWA